MKNSRYITLINRRGELEKFDILNFSKFIVGKFLLLNESLENERDDLIQEACLTVLKKKEKLENFSSFSYLYFNYIHYI